jgi:hypothetical protein
MFLEKLIVPQLPYLACSQGSATGLCPEFNEFQSCLGSLWLILYASPSHPLYDLRKGGSKNYFMYFFYGSYAFLYGTFWKGSTVYLVAQT